MALTSRGFGAHLANLDDEEAGIAESRPYMLLPVVPRLMRHPLL